MKPFTDRIFYLDDDTLVHIHYANPYWITSRLFLTWRNDWRWMTVSCNGSYEIAFDNIKDKNPELLLEEKP